MNAGVQEDQRFRIPWNAKSFLYPNSTNFDETKPRLLITYFPVPVRREEGGTVTFLNKGDPQHSTNSAITDLARYFLEVFQYYKFLCSQMKYMSFQSIQIKIKFLFSSIPKKTICYLNNSRNGCIKKEEIRARHIIQCLNICWKNMIQNRSPSDVTDKVRENKHTNTPSEK